MLAALRTAFAFLTILPIRPPRDLTPSSLAASSLFFPTVGWLLGGVMGGGAWLASSFQLPPLAAAALLVSLHLWLTRGLHLDGLADLLDGLGGGHTAERRLAIMKDSAVGVFGAAGLVLLLLAKASALAVLVTGLPPASGLPSIIAPPVAARWAMAALAWRSRYPRPAGTGHPFVGQITALHLAGAALWLLPLILFSPQTAVVFLVSLVPALWLRIKAHRDLGGVTGDVLGASCELGEAAGWLAAAALL